MAFISVRTAELLNRRIREGTPLEPVLNVDERQWTNGREWDVFLK